MKKFSFLMLAMAGMLFAACSSDKDAVVEGSNPDFNGQSDGFFKISINLPTAPVVSMRAWSESTAGTLNDGLLKEYAVEKVLLLIFDGNNEGAAKMKQCIDLGTWDAGSHDDDPNQITTRKDDYIAELKTTPTGNLYALAVVNPNGIIAAGTADNKLVVNGDTEHPLTEPTLADIKAKLVTSDGVSDNDFIKVNGDDKYFFMTNALLSKSKGGTSDPSASPTLQTLAPIDKSFIYESESKAQAGQAATDIYVERAVAKVTLDTTTDADYLETTALTASADLSLSASLSGWSLDNTNKSSYIIHQAPAGLTWNLTSNKNVGGDKYRFVGGNPVDPAVTLYRTYWADDPNYSTAWASGTFSNVEASAITNTAVGDENPLYCFENTFDVAHQSFQNTTRAILAIKLTTGTDNFYVIGADRKTLYTETDVKNKVVDYIMSQPAFVSWFNDPDAAKGGKGTLTGAALTVTFDKAVTAAGKLQVVSFTVPAANTDAGTDITVSSSSTAVEGHDLSGVIATLNTQLNNVERFVGGIAYYPIRIKHFGDDLTPWNDGEWTAGNQPKEDGINDIYPTTPGQDANYLGRYGMVRNNWYDLVIGEILKIGSSTVPELSTHPDDELESLYIKARINILSWAKRTQNWDLK